MGRKVAGFRMWLGGRPDRGSPTMLETWGGRRGGQKKKASSWLLGFWLEQLDGVDGGGAEGKGFVMEQHFPKIVETGRYRFVLTKSSALGYRLRNLCKVMSLIHDGAGIQTQTGQALELTVQ